MQRRDFLTTTPLTLGLVTFGAASLFGCAKDGAPPPTVDEYKPLLRLAVSLGTDRLLSANPGIAPLMVRTLKVIEDILDRGTFTSVAEVADLLHRVIPWQKLDVMAKTMVEALIAAVSEEIRVLAQRYGIPDRVNLLLVREVIAWAREVAQRHEAQPVKVHKVAML